MRNVWFVHPTGNANVRASLDALSHANLLEKFFTTVAVDANTRLSSILPESLSSLLSRRGYPTEQLSYFQRHWMHESLRLLAIQLGLRSLGSSPDSWLHHTQVFGRLDQQVARRLERAKQPPRAILCHTDCAVRSFSMAKQRNVRRVLELPIAHFQTLKKILDRECERYPDWAETMTITSSLKQNEQRRQELELSETILCPSRFVISSIPTDVIKSKRVILAQYGMARVATSLPTKDLPTRRSDKRLRLLFVGQMSQRKGFADLLHALRKLSTPRVELTVVGSRFMDLSFYKHIYADFIYQPPMSRDRVFELMRSADLLVLPTLAEGRVLVVLEALANGLPVVTTVNSGCDDVIQEGLNGCLVPTSDVDALAATIDEFLKAPQRIDEMKRYMADQQPIAGWEPYRRSVVEAVS